MFTSFSNKKEAVSRLSTDDMAMIMDCIVALKCINQVDREGYWSHGERNTFTRMREALLSKVESAVKTASLSTDDIPF